jgi:hypothetical protein
MLVASACALLWSGCGDPESPREERSGPLERVVAQSTGHDALARSILLTAADLGSGWQSVEELARAAGLPIDVAARVEPALIDPGLEDPDSRCGVSLLLGLPDGVKTGTAVVQWMRTDEDSSGHISSAAAVFPSEKNAEARFAAYEAAMWRCNEEILLGFQSSDELPLGLKPTIEIEELDLPQPAFGVRFKSGLGLVGFGDGDQTEVVVRRGRVIAAFSMNNFIGGASLPDAKTLAAIVIARVETAEANLEEDDAPLPIWEPDPGAQGVADAALVAKGDFPSAWQAAPTPEPIEIGPGGVELVSSTGSRMYAMSQSPACTAGNLHPTVGMLARAGSSLIRVGHDHDLWQYAAVFEDEDIARDRVTAILEANKRCSEEILAQRSPDVNFTWTPIEFAATDENVHVSVGIQRWISEAHDPVPASEHVTTEATIVIRRGRMISTASFVTGGENQAAVDELVSVLVRKLEAAAGSLDD